MPNVRQTDRTICLPTTDAIMWIWKEEDDNMEIHFYESLEALTASAMDEELCLDWERTKKKD